MIHKSNVSHEEKCDKDLNIFPASASDQSSLSINTPHISIFEDIGDKNPSTVTLLSFLEDIRSGTGTSDKRLIQRYRRTGNKTLKRGLPCATISGTFQGGHNGSDFVTHSGCLIVDIDGKGNNHIFNDEGKAQELVNQLTTLPHCVAVWRTVSLKIAAVFKVRPEQHLQAFLTYQQEFAEKGITTDASVKDVTRLRYTSFDPSIYINPLLAEAFDSIPVYEPKEGILPVRNSAPKKEAVHGEANESANLTVDTVVNYAHKAGKNFNDGERNDFIVYVAHQLNRYGVSLAEAEAALDQAVGLSGFDDHLKSLRDIYARNEHEHSTVTFNPPKRFLKKWKFSIKDHLTDFTPTPAKTNYSATVNRYLSEYKLPLEGNLILQVPTNCGKTRYFASFADGKRILLVPTVSLAKQVEARYGIKAVYEGISVQKDDTVLVATYDALPKLYQTLRTFNFTLYIDEAHNYVQSTSKSYRNKALSLVAEYSELFQRVILFSGTWIPTSSPLFEDFRFINIKSEAKQLGKFQYILTNNKKELLRQHIAAHRDALHAIYYNDKDAGQALATELEKVGLGSFLVLNRNTQKNAVQTKFIDSGILPDQYRGVIFTDLIKEGLGIENEGVPVDVHFLTKACSVTTEQVINRPRNVVPRAFYYVTKTDTVSPFYYTQEERLGKERELFTEAQELVQTLEETRLRMRSMQQHSLFKQFFRKDAKESNEALTDYRDQLVNITSNIEEASTINQLGVINAAWQWYEQKEKANPRMLLNAMATYGYQVEIVEKDVTSSGFAEAANGTKGTIKEATVQTNQAFVSVLAAHGAAFASEVEESPLSTRTEKDLAFKYRFFSERLLNQDDVLAQMEELVNHPKKWALVKDKLQHQITVNTTLHFKRSTNAYQRAITSAFTIGQKYTSAEVEAIVKKVMGKFKKTASSVEGMTAKRAVEILKSWYTVTEPHNNSRAYRVVKVGAYQYELQKPYTTPYQPEQTAQKSDASSDSVIRTIPVSSVRPCNVQLIENQLVTEEKGGQTLHAPTGANGMQKAINFTSKEADHAAKYADILAIDFNS